jgi:hypothetical protein
MIWPPGRTTRGNVYAGDFGVRIIVSERQTGADTYFENATAYVSRSPRSGTSPVDEDRPAQRVVDRRPARVGFFRHVTIGIARHGPSRIVLSDAGVTSPCDSQATRR